MGDSLRASLSAHNKGLYAFQSPVEKLILRFALEQVKFNRINFQKNT